MVRVIHGFRSGKTTRRGEPLSPEQMPPAETVTVVSRDAALEAFGCRTRGELITFLRRQRTLGVLVADRNRLTKRVRASDGTHERYYVVRGSSTPRLRSASRRVTYW